MLCTICARGSSRRAPGKNARVIAGRPLIAHTIEQARETGLFRHIAVSSDSPAILEAGRAAGADILVQRPDELASDTAAKPPAIRHCVEEVERRTGLTFDVMVDLDATSPLRIPADIKGAVDLLTSSGCGNVITGAPAHRSPYFNLVERRANGTVSVSKPPVDAVFRRQDAPPCFDMNASIYAWTRAAFMTGPAVFMSDTRLYEMPAERSFDIDSELDWDIVEFLLSRRMRSAT